MGSMGLPPGGDPTTVSRACASAGSPGAQEASTSEPAGQHLGAGFLAGGSRLVPAKSRRYTMTSNINSEWTRRRRRSRRESQRTALPRPPAPSTGHRRSACVLGSRPLPRPQEARPHPHPHREPCLATEPLNCKSEAIQPGLLKPQVQMTVSQSHLRRPEPGDGHPHISQQLYRRTEDMTLS